VSHDRFAERRRTVAEDRARRALRRATLIIGMAAAISGVVYLFHSPLFSIRTLEVTGAVNAIIEPVLGRHGISEGEPLIWTDVDGATTAIAADPWVESVTVARSWPTTVQVALVERRPVAVADGSAVAVDGVILPEAPTEGLPQMAIEGEEAGGRYPQQEILGALRFLATLRSDLATDATVAATADGLIAVVEGYTVRLGRPVDMEEKARALAPVVDESPPKGSEITLVAPARPSVLAPDAVVAPGLAEDEDPEASDEG
jgi:cell division protein FtsQ